VSVVSKGALDLTAQVKGEKQNKDVRGETELAKITVFCTASGRKSDEAVSTAEGVFSFHTVKHYLAT